MWSTVGKLLTAAIVAAVVVAALMAWNIVEHGISARETPTRTEAMLATSLRSMAVPRAAKAMTNPVPLTDVGLSKARAHWADHCAPCHGADGKAKTEIARGMYPPVPDMSDGAPNLSDGELYAIITNGVRLTGMPGWGDQVPEETWQLVHLIRHLPKLTPAELESMRKEKEGEEEFLSGK